MTNVDILGVIYLNMRTLVIDIALIFMAKTVASQTAAR